MLNVLEVFMSDIPPYIAPDVYAPRYEPFIISVPDRKAAFTQFWRHAQNCLALALLADARIPAARAHHNAASTRGLDFAGHHPLGSCLYRVPLPMLKFYVGSQHVQHPLEFESDPFTLEVEADPNKLRSYSPRRAQTLEKMLGKGSAVGMSTTTTTPIWEYMADREQFGRKHPRAGAYHLEMLEYLLTPHKGRLEQLIS